MRPVVLDPELIAAGLLGRPRPRKLLGLLGYGRWCQYALLAGAAEEARIREESVEGSRRGGPSTAEQLEFARRRQAVLEEMVPYGTPQDLVLAGSSRIHDAVVERIQIARSVEPGLHAVTDAGERARTLTVSLTATLVGDIGGAYGEHESLTDHLIYVAARAPSAPLVTDDEALAPRDGTMWRHTSAVGGLEAIAVTFWTFANEHIDGATFGLDDLPLELLDEVVRGVALPPRRTR